MQFTKSAGREFHSIIALGKKENLKTSLDTFGILYLKAWLLCVLFSLFGIKCPSVFMSTRLWLSLYIRVNLLFFRLVSNVSHFRSDNMSVTLAVLLKFLKAKTGSFSLNSLQGWNIFCSVGPTRHLRTPVWVGGCWYRPFHVISWGSSRDFSWSTPRIDSPCLRQMKCVQTSLIYC